MAGNVKKSFSKGLTFIELMVAITILMIAIATILVSVNFASKVARHNLNKAMAMNLVAQKMEQIKNDSYAHIIPANYPAESNIVVGSSPVSFNRTVTIQLVTGSYTTVTVTVTWTQLGTPFQETESAVTIISP